MKQFLNDHPELKSALDTFIAVFVFQLLALLGDLTIEKLTLSFLGSLLLAAFRAGIKAATSAPLKQ